MGIKDMLWATMVGLRYMKDNYEPNTGTPEDMAMGCIDTMQSMVLNKITELENFNKI